MLTLTGQGQKGPLQPGEPRAPNRLKWLGQTGLMVYTKKTFFKRIGVQ